MDLLAFDGVPGASYLGIYLGVCVGLWVVSWCLSWWLRRPGGDGVGLSLDREQIAFLAGGPQRTLAAALASLVQEGTIGIERSSTLKAPPCARRQGPLPSGATRLERALVAEGTGVPLEPSVIERLGQLPEITTIRGSLMGAWLVLAPDAAWEARVWPALVIGAAVPFAIPRLILAHERDRPVGLLVAMMLAVALLVVMRLLARGVVRSRRGDAVLAHYERRLGRAGASAPVVDQVVLRGAAACFDLTGIFPVPGNDSSGGDGGGDGGCGGGGCGGCGGCGG